MLYLKAANLADIEEEYYFLSRMPSENGFENPFLNIERHEFETEGLPKLIRASQGLDLKPGYVPDTYFFLWDEDHIVGVFKIRHYLNENLRQGGGHIGYGILPEFRKRGYATKGLALALAKCQEILPKEETEVYLACWKSNPASLKVQLHNGAYIHHESAQEYYTRIPLKRITEEG